MWSITRIGVLEAQLLPLGIIILKVKKIMVLFHYIQYFFGYIFVLILLFI